MTPAEAEERFKGKRVLVLGIFNPDGSEQEVYGFCTGIACTYPLTMSVRLDSGTQDRWTRVENLRRTDEGKEAVAE